MDKKVLKKELQSLDIDTLFDAFARAQQKTKVIGEAKAQTNALQQEYEGLGQLPVRLLQVARESGLDEKTAQMYTSGAMAVCMSLKEIIDSAELGSIPTFE